MIYSYDTLFDATILGAKKPFLPNVTFYATGYSILSLSQMTRCIDQDRCRCTPLRGSSLSKCDPASLDHLLNKTALHLRFATHFKPETTASSAEEAKKTAPFERL